MGYQALLFCPDEKTARTVTQVLSELEFNVESCIEPFAAVKKLMGQHFDAVVVDCDNEQNATLLFKSARNSTSNQASLAVAVVEGQAGVAKAFRIGANLVLTKPINIEQAKGTLRVARGLLRKSDPAKPAATATPVPSAAVADKPSPSVKPAVPATPTAASTPRPAVPPIAKPAPTSAWPAPAAAASSTPAADDEVLPEISVKESIAAPVPAALPVSFPAAEVKPSFKAGLPASHGGGAASAPAPAREIPAAPAMEPSHKSTATDAGALFATKEAPPNASPSYSGSAPSFSFGGANTPVESSGGSKKIFLGVAAAALVAVGLYVGWTKFQGHSSQPEATPTTSTPATATTAAALPIAKPSAQPAAPTTSVSQPISQPAAVPVKSQAAEEVESAPDAAVSSTPTSTRGSTASTPSANKAASESKTEDAPLMVKGGKTPSVHAAPAAADTPAPSMIGIAATGASAPPPDLGSSEATAPRPLLQTLNISQGVSRGLLIKKVQPVYPKNALFMQVEGSVELMATISKAGDITHVKVLSGDSQLTKAATDAVKQWKYKPYLLNGEPVEIQTQVTINFKLPR